MPQVINCPHCRQAMGIGPELAGQVISCPTCQGKLRVPPATAPMAIPLAPQAPLPPVASAPSLPPLPPSTSAAGQPAWPAVSPSQPAPQASPRSPTRPNPKRRAAKKSGIPVRLIWAAIGGGIGLIGLVASLLMQDPKATNAAAKRLSGAWELDLASLGRDFQRTRVGGRPGVSIADELKAAGIGMQLTFRTNGSATYRSNDGETTDNSQGKWTVEAAYKDELHVAVRWGNDLTRERLRIKFLRPDRIQVESRAWFNNSTLELVRVPEKRATK